MAPPSAPPPRGAGSPPLASQGAQAAAAATAATAVPGHTCTVLAQQPVLRHYGVPQVSLAEAFGKAEERAAWMTNVYFVDHLHPSVTLARQPPP